MTKNTTVQSTQPDRHQGGSAMVSAKSRGTRGAASENVWLTSSIDGNSARLLSRGAAGLDVLGGSWLADMTTDVSTTAAAEA